MKNKYYTPNIEDLKVGYQCEIKPIKSEEFDWMPYIINGDNSFNNYFKDSIRTAYLTKEDIESQGFERYSRSIDDWFKIKEELKFDTDLQNFFGYKAYNVFLNYGYHDQRIHIKVDFLGGTNYSDSDTIFQGECRCINDLKEILKKVHIIPFYER